MADQLSSCVESDGVICLRVGREGRRLLKSKVCVCVSCCEVKKRVIQRSRCGLVLMERPRGKQGVIRQKGVSWLVGCSLWSEKECEKVGEGEKGVSCPRYRRVPDWSKVEG